ncbi:fasciclin-like arabinogalactan protein 8 [Mangifera indica]|uniref:fasciclin-like arabinogalactan protein 8 n=1 Tax=Mangifera indica TaxID=29780 RepID=UPI001CF9F9CF|nr:fasciclin-like arabinogalactan protein 8 [Mangifera indica]
MRSTRSLFLVLIVSAMCTAVTAHNITDILKDHPEYSQFNGYLSQTKLADEINRRTTITVLVLNNSAMSALVGNNPITVIKDELMVHVLLDYFDGKKLHQFSNGTTLTTTLYQTTGNAQGNSGFVNITDLRGGKVAFGAAALGSKLDSFYSKSIKQIPYNISVIKISYPIIVQSILAAPAPSASDVNITALLEKAGCKTFAGLLVSSGVIKTYESAVADGLTVFAPSDEAFKAKGVPDLSKLRDADVVALLEYHAASSYNPVGTLIITKNPISTLATKGLGKFDLTVTTAGDEVTLHTGVASSRVAATVLDSTPLAILTVDNVLLPSELFGKAPSPAPAREPAQSPLDASQPAAPSETPAESPADGSEDSTVHNASVHENAPAFFAAVLTVICSVILS